MYGKRLGRSCIGHFRNTRSVSTVESARVGLDDESKTVTTKVLRLSSGEWSDFSLLVTMCGGGFGFGGRDGGCCGCDDEELTCLLRRTLAKLACSGDSFNLSFRDAPDTLVGPFSDLDRADCEWLKATFGGDDTLIRTEQIVLLQEL